MALNPVTLALAIFVASVSATVELVSVKGSVSCDDCTGNYDYSGISIALECDQMKKPVMTTTEGGGSFEAKLPMTPRSRASCKARLVGGPNQLYALNKNMVSNVINQANAYATANTMTFATSCSTLAKRAKCPATQFDSSKTFDLFPPAFGLPPSSYYGMPFLPIIGIP